MAFAFKQIREHHFSFVNFNAPNTEIGLDCNQCQSNNEISNFDGKISKKRELLMIVRDQKEKSIPTCVMDITESRTLSFDMECVIRSRFFN